MSVSSDKESIMAAGMHKMRRRRSLASLMGEGEGSENFSTLDSVDSEDSSLGPYYEDTLRVVLAGVWRHKLSVLATIAVALVIGIALAHAMPKRYTAEAYVNGGFADAVTAYGKSTGGGVAALDASVLAETRARLLQSQQLARRVVGRLGLERIRPAVSEGLISSWLRPNSGHGKFAGHLEDMAAKRLLRGLSVTTERGEYLITVRYTAGDPELAALITNAFVTELLQTTRLQSLSQQQSWAQQELSQQLATLGAKHPKVLEAIMRLEAADAALKAQMSKTNEEIERTADGNVSFAQVTAIPSSPNPSFLIGVALLVGLAGGVVIAALRRRSETKQS
jgi:uncharacterized protein involved in exopolysaccharide biosynthesis